MNKAIFLDRDGVLNDVIIRNGKPYPPKSLQVLTIADDVLPALICFKSMGYMLIGATNQPDVARGKTLKIAVEEINNYLLEKLPLNEIRVCYHDDHEACGCRKPEPGLLLQAAEDYSIDLKQSIMIGDRWKDVEAGHRAGCKTIWLNRQYQEPQPKQAPDFVTTCLSSAAEWVQQIQLKGE